MRPDQRSAPPEEWIKRAKSHLVRARQPKPDGVLWEDLCFDAQQAAELAVKGVLIHLSVEFPKTHDIRRLLDLVQNSGLDVPEAIRLAEQLTPYATEIRYPGDFEPVSEEEFLRDLALAEAVVRWADDVLTGPQGKAP
jgi:HEPN domain-containing protein